MNKTFYKNKKTEQYLRSIGSQLPKDVKYALSNSYDKASFNKNQVDTDLKQQPQSLETDHLSDIKRQEETKMIQTNMGEMPMEDYLEIMANRYGFDSYEELREAGLNIKLPDSIESEQSESEIERDLSQTKFKENTDYISLDDSFQTLTVSYLNKDGNNGHGHIVVDEYDIGFLKEHAQKHGNETLYESASGFAKETIEDDITQIAKYLNGKPIDSKLTLNELIGIIEATQLNQELEQSKSKTEPLVSQKKSLEEFLGERGMSSPISDFLDDKLRSNRQLRTQRGVSRFAKEAEQHRIEYFEKRKKAIEEYNTLVNEGKIIPKTSLEKTLDKAQGHPDNPSVQAARRIAEKKRD